MLTVNCCVDTQSTGTVASVLCISGQDRGEPGCPPPPRGRGVVLLGWVQRSLRTGNQLDVSDQSPRWPLTSRLPCGVHQFSPPSWDGGGAAGDRRSDTSPGKCETKQPCAQGDGGVGRRAGRLSEPSCLVPEVKPPRKHLRVLGQQEIANLLIYSPIVLTLGQERELEYIYPPQGFQARFEKSHGICQVPSAGSNIPGERGD